MQIWTGTWFKGKEAVFCLCVCVCMCVCVCVCVKARQSFHADIWYNLFFAGDFVTKSHFLLGFLIGPLRLPFPALLRYEWGPMCLIPVFPRDLGCAAQWWEMETSSHVTTTCPSNSSLTFCLHPCCPSSMENILETILNNLKNLWQNFKDTWMQRGQYNKRLPCTHRLISILSNTKLQIVRQLGPLWDTFSSFLFSILLLLPQFFMAKAYSTSQPCPCHQLTSSSPGLSPRDLALLPESPFLGSLGTWACGCRHHPCSVSGRALSKLLELTPGTVLNYKIWYTSNIVCVDFLKPWYRQWPHIFLLYILKSRYFTPGLKGKIVELKQWEHIKMLLFIE